MNCLIIENEIYLAQSIAAKLAEYGFECEITASVKGGFKDTSYDIVLLSTGLSTESLQPTIERFKDSIVIMMVSYINNDTVSIPLKLGAKDYLLKPFMIEELIKKISHYTLHEKLKRACANLEAYTTYSLEHEQLSAINKKTELPIMLVSNSQKTADAYAFKLIEQKESELLFVKLSSGVNNALGELTGNKIAYIVGFDELRKNDKKHFVESCEGKNVIIFSSGYEEESPVPQLLLPSSAISFSQSELLPIEEYIKQALVSYQDRYPDIELAKKLGISRKSLWEKRRKHGIHKKK